jgi:hypothetical protein
MKKQLFILIIALLPLLTKAQKTIEVKTLTTSTKKVISKPADNFLLLFDPSDFINSMDKVASKTTKILVTKADKKFLKNYLKTYFNTHDTLNSTNNSVPGNMQRAFILLFLDYLNVTLNKGNCSVYNISTKAYENNILVETEEKIGENVIMGMKIKDSVKVINTTTSYFTNNKQTMLHIYTDTRTENK